MTELDEEQLRTAWGIVSRAMNRIAAIWEKDGSDPCRVRITKEYANAYRAYAEGLGQPTGYAKEKAPAAAEPKTGEEQLQALMTQFGSRWMLAQGRGARSGKDYAVWAAAKDWAQAHPGQAVAVVGVIGQFRLVWDPATPDALIGPHEVPPVSRETEEPPDTSWMEDEEIKLDFGRHKRRTDGD